MSGFIDGIILPASAARDIAMAVHSGYQNENAIVERLGETLRNPKEKRREELAECQRVHKEIAERYRQMSAMFQLLEGERIMIRVLKVPARKEAEE